MRIFKDVEDRFIYVIRLPGANGRKKIIKGRVENFSEPNISVTRLKEIPGYKETKENTRNVMWNFKTLTFKKKKQS